MTITIAAEKPEGIAEDNWLPIERGDLAIGLSVQPCGSMHLTWKNSTAVSHRLQKRLSEFFENVESHR